MIGFVLLVIPFFVHMKIAVSSGGNRMERLTRCLYMFGHVPGMTILLENLFNR